MQDSLKAKWTCNFDNILGNPPYVKFQDISSDNRFYLQSKWKTCQTGSFNLYFAFFELGLMLLKDKGQLGYITPNNFFTSLAGEPLREFFQTTKCVYKIIDFKHSKIFDAQTYTAITLLKKEITNYILFDRIEGKQNPDSFLKAVNPSRNYLSNLNSSKWRLLKEDEHENIFKIENSGNSIGELFEICVGIATLKDEVFFVDGDNVMDNYYYKSTRNGVFKIEKEVVKAVYKISEFRSQAEIEIYNKKIIFPYSFNHGKANVIKEDDFKKLFPKCYEYLLTEREALITRDKGKLDFNPFYVWGRTQGLTRKGIKIVNPTFSQKPRFLVVKDEDAFFTNGYGLFFKNRNSEFNLFSNEYCNPISLSENINSLQKILNSCIMNYYINKTSVSIEGGYPCYQKNFIEKFTIPNFTNEEINYLNFLNAPEEINNFLISKYQLNEFDGNLFL